MSSKIIGTHHWTQSALGHYLLEWEQQRCDEAVADIFGYHSLQLGMPMLQGLRANRMPHRWLALDSMQDAAPAEGVPPLEVPVALLADPAALPFSEASLDLVVMPHTLETSPDPHAVLREAARVLMPEGRIVVCGLNPASLLGVQRRAERGVYLPDVGWGVGYWRLRDWLRLLAFEIEAVQFGCYRPAVQTDRWLRRWQFMDRVGRLGWPMLGGVYCVVAVKRVPGARMLEPAWRGRAAVSGASVPVAHSMPTQAVQGSDPHSNRPEGRAIQPKEIFLNQVVIYTDGACKGNPGPGGWGVVLESGSARKELFGGELNTTNNRMEMMAVIEALSALRRPCDVVLYIDSQYVLKGITEWIHGWKAKGWKTASKEPVKNVELWQRLDALVQGGGHRIDWRWVKGHAGDPGNERADALANKGVDQALGR